jgi:hypothetical protein
MFGRDKNIDAQSKIDYYLRIRIKINGGTRENDEIE